MTDHLRARRSVARTVLTTVLLLGVLAVNIPYSSLASSTQCNLACCAGLPAHEAGSCMGGSCHTGLLKVLRAHARRYATNEENPEPLCGAPKQITGNVASRINPDTVKADENQNNRIATALKKPCESECGACAGSVNSGRQRHSIALLGGANSKSGCGGQRRQVTVNLLNRTRLLIRQSSPRGPPLPTS